jgi:hypothetical protein
MKDSKLKTKRYSFAIAFVEMVQEKQKVKKEYVFSL